MASQDANAPRDAPKESILEKLERFVAESRSTNTSQNNFPQSIVGGQGVSASRHSENHNTPVDRVYPFPPYQFPIALGSVQNTGGNKIHASDLNQSPNTSQNDFPQSIAGGHELSASRHSESPNGHRDEDFYSQALMTASEAHSAGGYISSPFYHDQGSKTPHSAHAPRNQPPSAHQVTSHHHQTPRGPRNNVGGNKIPFRPQRIENIGGGNGTTSRKNQSSNVPRQTARSQNWHNRHDQNSSANQHHNSNAGPHNNANVKRGQGANVPWDGKSSVRQKNFRGEQNSNDKREKIWNARRDQNPRPRQNQHAAKFNAGKKPTKVGTNDDWRYEDAVNDEDLARWYE